jgi:hypothetical protein
MENFLLPYMALLLEYVPQYLVWIIGLILSIIHYKKHSKVSILTLISLSMLFAFSLIYTFLKLWLPINAMNKGIDVSDISTSLLLITIIKSLLSAVAWSMMITAIFGWRKQVLSSSTET